jgi:hypothetical protein
VAVPHANGATWSPEHKECYAELGMPVEHSSEWFYNSSSASWEVCHFGEQHTGYKECCGGAQDEPFEKVLGKGGRPAKGGGYKAGHPTDNDWMFCEPACTPREYGESGYGNIAITRNTKLLELSLPVLGYVNGDLDIDGNLALVAIDFPALGSTGEDFWIYDNPAVTTISFPSLTDVGYEFWVGPDDIAEDALISMDFGALERIWDELYLVSTNVLKAARFPKLLAVGEAFYLYGNLGLETLEIPELAVIGERPFAWRGYRADVMVQADEGAMYIYDNAKLEALLTPKLDILAWGATIYRNAELVQIDLGRALGAFCSPVDEDYCEGLSVYENPRLEKLTAMEMHVVAYHFSVTNNAALKLIEVPRLANITENLELDYNSNLTTANFPALKWVGEDLEVYDCAELASVSVPMLVEVGDDLELGDNSKLTAAHFPALRRVGDDLEIYDCAELASIALPLLAEIDDDLHLEDNLVLAEVLAPVLVKIGDDFYYAHNGQGVPAGSTPAKLDFGLLAWVESGFHMHDNFNLGEVSFPAFETIGDCDGIEVYHNPNMTAFAAPAMVRMECAIEIYDNDKLMAVRFDALTVLEHDTFEVRGNPALVELVLPLLGSVPSFEVHDNENLVRVILPLLVNVTSDFEVYNNPALLKLEIPTLAAVESDFEVYGNSDLRSVELPTLVSVGDAFWVYDVPMANVLAAPVLARTGDVWIGLYANPAAADVLKAIALPQLELVAGSFEVHDTKALAGLALPALVAVAGEMKVVSNAKLGTLALPELVWAGAEPCDSSGSGSSAGSSIGSGDGPDHGVAIGLGCSPALVIDWSHNGALFGACVKDATHDVWKAVDSTGSAVDLAETDFTLHTCDETTTSTTSTTSSTTSSTSSSTSSTALETIELIIDADYGTVLGSDEALAAELGKLLLTELIAADPELRIWGPVRVSKGSIVLSAVMVQADQGRLASVLSGCGFCFEFAGATLCPRPAGGRSCVTTTVSTRPAKGGADNFRAQARQNPMDGDTDASSGASNGATEPDDSDSSRESSGGSNWWVYLIAVAAAVAILLLIVAVVISRRQRNRQCAKDVTATTDLADGTALDLEAGLSGTGTLSSANEYTVDETDGSLRVKSIRRSNPLAATAVGPVMPNHSYEYNDAAVGDQAYAACDEVGALGKSTAAAPAAPADYAEPGFMATQRRDSRPRTYAEPAEAANAKLNADCYLEPIPREEDVYDDCGPGTVKMNAGCYPEPTAGVPREEDVYDDCGAATHRPSKFSLYEDEAGSEPPVYDAADAPQSFMAAYSDSAPGDKPPVYDAASHDATAEGNHYEVAGNEVAAAGNHYEIASNEAQIGVPVQE